MYILIKINKYFFNKDQNKLLIVLLKILSKFSSKIYF